MQYCQYKAFDKAELKIMLFENEINKFWALLFVSSCLRCDN